MMPPEDPTRVAEIAAVAAGSSALVRVVLALHGGVRSIVGLAVEGLVGACLGVMIAGGIIYLDPAIVGTPRELLIIAGAAGWAGAIGTRLLDLVIDIVKRRLGA